MYKWYLAMRLESPTKMLLICFGGRIDMTMSYPDNQCVLTIIKIMGV